MKVGVFVQAGYPGDPERQELTVVVWETEAESILDGLAKLRDQTDELVQSRIPPVITLWPQVNVPTVFPFPSPGPDTGDQLPALPQTTCMAEPAPPFTPETAPVPDEIPF